MMRSSTAMGFMFNIIDTNEGLKADLVPLRREPEYQVAFGRRIRREFTDPTDAKTPIFEFIEAWYNRQRLHSTLGYQSPSDFEQTFRH
jgi:transposase InsO family protein